MPVFLPISTNINKQWVNVKVDSIMNFKIWLINCVVDCFFDRLLYILYILFVVPLSVNEVFLLLILLHLAYEIDNYFFKLVNSIPFIMCYTYFYYNT